jgi:hypothetical protein
MPDQSATTAAKSLPTNSTTERVGHSPSPHGGEGRAPALRMVEGAAGERLDVASLSNARNGRLPHCEPSRQRGAAIRGRAPQQPSHPTHRQPQPLASQGEGRAAAGVRFAPQRSPRAREAKPGKDHRGGAARQRCAANVASFEVDSTAATASGSRVPWAKLLDSSCRVRNLAGTPREAPHA